MDDSPTTQNNQRAVGIMRRLRKDYGLSDKKLRGEMERISKNDVPKQSVAYYFTLGRKGFKQSFIPLNTPTRVLMYDAMKNLGVPVSELMRVFGQRIEQHLEDTSDTHARVTRMERDLAEIKEILRHFKQ